MGTCETGVLRCFDARHEASMWSEWLCTYMYSVCIREPAPGYAPGFAPVFGGRPERDYIADIRLLLFPAAGMSRAR